METNITGNSEESVTLSSSETEGRETSEDVKTKEPEVVDVKAAEVAREKEEQKRLLQENYDLRRQLNSLSKDIESIKQKSSEPKPIDEKEILQKYLEAEWDNDPQATEAILYKRAKKAMEKDKWIAGTLSQKDNMINDLSQQIKELSKSVKNLDPKSKKFEEIKKIHAEIEDMSKEEAAVYLFEKMEELKTKKSLESEDISGKKKGGIQKPSANNEPSSAPLPDWFIKDCEKMDLKPTPERFQRLYGEGK